MMYRIDAIVVSKERSRARFTDWLTTCSPQRGPLSTNISNEPGWSLMVSRMSPILSPLGDASTNPRGSNSEYTTFVLTPLASLPYSVCTRISAFWQTGSVANVFRILASLLSSSLSQTVQFHVLKWSKSNGDVRSRIEWLLMMQ